MLLENKFRLFLFVNDGQKNGYYTFIEPQCGHIWIPTGELTVKWCPHLIHFTEKGTIVFVAASIFWKELQRSLMELEKSYIILLILLLPSLNWLRPAHWKKADKKPGNNGRRCDTPFGDILSCYYLMVSPVGSDLKLVGLLAPDCDAVFLFFHVLPPANNNARLLRLLPLLLFAIFWIAGSSSKSQARKGARCANNQKCHLFFLLWLSSLYLY